MKLQVLLKTKIPTVYDYTIKTECVYLKNYIKLISIIW
jgi:hypothetical protein